MLGVIFPSDVDATVAWSCASRIDMTHDVFRDVAPQEVQTYEGGETRIMLIDCGAKDQIVRSLQSRGATILRVPWHLAFEKYLWEVDGIVIGNGPGDPENLAQLSDAVRSVLDKFRGPVFGVCLGHQILAKAVGATTYKLPYGHRGINHPVQEVNSLRAFITSQNHGFAVDEKTLPTDWQPWMVNLNDGTNEGNRSLTKPHWSVQFHPEGSPGPHDTKFLFDDFLACARAVGCRRDAASN